MQSESRPKARRAVGSLRFPVSGATRVEAAWVMPPCGPIHKLQELFSLTQSPDHASRPVDSVIHTVQSHQRLRLKLWTVEVLGVLSAHRGLTRWAERIASQSSACCRLIAASSEQSDSRRSGLGNATVRANPQASGAVFFNSVLDHAFRSVRP